MSIKREIIHKKVKRKHTQRINPHKPTPLIKGGVNLELKVEAPKCDDNYILEVMKELGIDRTKRRRSRLPRNRIGIPVIGGAGRTMVEMYREEQGKC